MECVSLFGKIPIRILRKKKNSKSFHTVIEYKSCTVLKFLSNMYYGELPPSKQGVCIFPYLCLEHFAIHGVASALTKVRIIFLYEIVIPCISYKQTDRQTHTHSPSWFLLNPSIPPFQVPSF